MLPRRIGRRRINEALAVVSPLGFADAVESYVTGLPIDDVRTLVQRSIKRMDSSERMQFAFFLGHDVASGRADDVFSNPTMRAEEVQRLVDSCDDFLPNRFAAFLRENPRALPALPDDALTGILATLPVTQSDPQALPLGEQRRRIQLQGVLVFGLAVLIAVVPLIAQYMRQRSMVAESVNPVIVPMLPAAKILAHGAKAPPRKASQPYTSHRTIARQPHVTHVAPKHAVAFAPVLVKRHARVATRLHARHRIATRVASVWKFDRRYNPYFNRRARVTHVAAAPAAAAPAAAPAMSPFEARARLVVNAYLGAVIAGNTPRALEHLGLPAGADPKAISESSIVSRDTRANIVAVKPGDDGTTHVQVDIVGRRGEYFEVFSVAPDGPAVRIKDRFYIPVNRTAEEISARLLASKPR